MKKIVIAVAIFMSSCIGMAQVKVPSPSPRAHLEQTVGLTTVDIEYSRPSAKGRNIFGNLVPFGKLWRTGANLNSTISFSEDVLIEGQKLSKGKYALFTIPKADTWEIIFYSEVDHWGVPKDWKEDKVALKVHVTPEILNKQVETFTIGFSTLTSDAAFLDIVWDKTLVPIQVSVSTKETAMASIEKVLSGPSGDDYYNSAQYFYQSNGDMNKALVWVNKAIDLNTSKPFYYYRLKSLIQVKLGDKKGAIETAKISLGAAEKVGNDDYIKMNKDSIVEWSKK